MIGGSVVVDNTRFFSNFGGCITATAGAVVTVRYDYKKKSEISQRSH
jgi:hypothetical protein